MIKSNLSTLILFLLAGITFTGPILSMGQAQSEEEIFRSLQQRFNRLLPAFKAEKEFKKSIDTLAKNAYDLYLDLSAFKVSAESNTRKELATFAIKQLKEIIEIPKSNVARAYTEKKGYAQPLKMLKEKVSTALKVLHLDHKVIFMTSATRSQSDWCVHQSEYNDYHYLLVYNPTTDFYSYAQSEDLFSIYHELGHIIHGDCCCKAKQAQNTKKLRYATAAGALIGTAIGALMLFKAKDTLDIALGLSFPLSFGCSVNGIARSSISQKKEHAADLFACKALLKENNVQAIIESFLWQIEDYEKRKVQHWFDHFSSHPSAFKRAKAILNFLQEHNFDLLALPIPAQDAKKFNAHLKQYFPDIYAQCIKQYAY